MFFYSYLSLKAILALLIILSLLYIFFVHPKIPIFKQKIVSYYKPEYISKAIDICADYGPENVSKIASLTKKITSDTPSSPVSPTPHSSKIASMRYIAKQKNDEITHINFLKKVEECLPNNSKIYESVLIKFESELIYCDAYSPKTEIGFLLTNPFQPREPIIETLMKAYNSGVYLIEIPFNLDYWEKNDDNIWVNLENPSKTKDEYDFDLLKLKTYISEALEKTYLEFYNNPNRKKPVIYF